MIAVLAVIAGSAFFLLIWIGTRRHQSSVRFAARGAGAVILGAFVIGGLLVVTDPGENLVIVEAAFDEGSGSGRTVAGVVENHTDHVMSPVRVKLDFIDRDSRIIASSTVETDRVESMGRWNFTVPVPSDSAAGFRGRVGSPDNVRPGWLGGGCGSSLCRDE